MKRWRILALLCLLAWGGRAQAAPKERWFAAGDSLTRNTGFEYPYQMDAHATVIAEPGARLGDVLDVQLPQMVAGGATLVTLTVGTNDVVQTIGARHGLRMPVERFRATLEWIVAFLRLSDPRRAIVVATLPAPRMFPATRAWTAEQRQRAAAQVQAYNAAIVSVARRRGCATWIFPTIPAACFLSDGFHPDRVGHATVAASLRPLLPSRSPPTPHPVPGLLVSPMTVFPPAGPPGTTVILRGATVGTIRRVVYFPKGGAAFRMCPVVDRHDDLLACAIPDDAKGTLELWAIRTSRPDRTSLLNRPVVRFTVRPARENRDRAHFSQKNGLCPYFPVGGVWLGIAKDAAGREVALRLDLDQMEDALAGRAFLAWDGRAAQEVARGRIHGRNVRIAIPGFAVRATLLADASRLRVSGALRGTLRRW